MKETKFDQVRQSSSRNNAEDLESNFSMSPPEINFSQNQSPMQLKGEEEEESMQMKANPLQLQAEEEEEEMAQAKMNPAQLQTEEEEEEMAQAKMNPAQLQTEEEEESMQMKENTGAVSSSPTSSANSIPENVQHKMESTMGADFSNVNVHKDSEKATNVGALAYAQGNDVHFAPGQYNPESKAGQELLGHELAHVVQQREGRVQTTMQKKGMNINNDQSLEREADQLGAKAANKKED